MRLASPRARLTSFALLAVVAAGLVTLAAQEPPRFRSGVEIVAIDVSAVDAEGRPVSDLKPDEFEVTVDRVPRRLASAQFIQFGPPVLRNLKRGPTAAPPLARPETPPLPPAPRTVIIVIDEDSLSTDDGLVARRTASQVVDALASDDRVAVLTVPRLPSRIELTSNRADAKRVLATSLSGLPLQNLEFNIGLSEAFAAERGDADAYKRVMDRECYNKIDSTLQPEGTSANVPRTDRQQAAEVDCPNRVRMQVRSMQLEGRTRSQRSLDALTQLAEDLRQVEGPKTMLLLTGGLPMPDLRVLAAFQRIESSFSAGQVTLYTLFFERSQFGRVSMKISPSAVEDDQLEQDGAENLTSAAGGTLLRAIGTMDQYVDRLMTELSGAYLLGIEATAADMDDRPHLVRVKVRRPGVDVRARKQYLIGPRTSRAQARRTDTPTSVRVSIGTPAGEKGIGETSYARMLEAARSMEGTGEVFVNLRAARVAGGGVGAVEGQVAVQATIDLRTVYFSVEDGRHMARLAVGTFCGDKNDTVVGQLWQEMNLALSTDTYEAYKSKGIPYTARIPVTGVPKHVKVIVYDRRADRLGAQTASLK
jgi:VWFA-related protein